MNGYLYHFRNQFWSEYKILKEKGLSKLKEYFITIYEKD